MSQDRAKAPGPGWESSRCTLTPCEVASRCRSLGNLAFLDTALLQAPRSTSARTPPFSLVAANPFTVLEGSDWNKLGSTLDQHIRAGEKNTALAVGCFHYEQAHRFGLYRQAAMYDHSSQQWWQLGGLLNDLPDLPAAAEAIRLEFRPDMQKEAFCEKVAIAREYIAAGDIYQVNLSHRFSADWKGDAMAFHERLRSASPKPYAALLESEKETLFCASPELFLDMNGRSITTRPIKGTRPRICDPGLDNLSAQELLCSAKEAAELLMITDLERNDLGRVCEVGSVNVEELMQMETYEQVFHLVSTVTGRLPEGLTHLAALRACFPGGSITGAPKKRAMEIIHELEPVPRGVYTGAIGCFGLGDRSVFNIAIRTATMSGGKIRFHVGAGIVADSEPELEYEETLHKAAGLLAAAK